MLSRRLDQSETPARLTTQPGGGACVQLLQEEAERRWERPKVADLAAAGHLRARVNVRVCMCTCVESETGGACAEAPEQWPNALRKSESRFASRVQGTAWAGTKLPSALLAGSPHNILRLGRFPGCSVWKRVQVAAQSLDRPGALMLWAN